MDGDEPISAILAGIGTAVTAGAATGGTATAIGAGTVASTAAGLASAGMQIASAVQGGPKLPGVPFAGATPEQIAQQQAAAQAARARVGRGATLLTGGGGGVSLMPTGQPLKTTLGG